MKDFSFSGSLFVFASSVDDVKGEIIGEIMLVGQLYYQDRPQGGRLYANTTGELLNMAKDRKRELINENPMIYRTDEWTLRIYQ